MIEPHRREQEYAAMRERLKAAKIINPELAHQVAVLQRDNRRLKRMIEKRDKAIERIRKALAYSRE